MKPTNYLRIVEWQAEIWTPSHPFPKITEVLEQMWVNEETGEVEYRELETISAKDAGYL